MLRLLVPALLFCLLTTRATASGFVEVGWSHTILHVPHDMFCSADSVSSLHTLATPSQSYTSVLLISLLPIVTLYVRRLPLLRQSPDPPHHHSPRTPSPSPPLPPSAFAQERVALEALYNATGGKHWSDSPANGWLSGPCHCQWTDVDCANETACNNSPVIAVVRQFDKNLVGVLPSWNGDPGQGALPQLQTLALTHNPGLTGSVPITWGSMVQMTVLYLAKNKLNGTLPASFGEMKQITNLELQANDFIGSLPESWCGMENITLLDVSANRLDGTLPGSWRAMKQMDYLNLVR